MPTYTYKCETCEHTYDKRQKFSDEFDTVCPECGAEVRRVISQVGGVFKGSGFYINDHAGSKSSTLGKKDTKSSSASKDGSASSSAE